MIELKNKNKDNVSREKIAYKIGAVGIGLNVFLFILKFVIGLVSSSVSVMVDAFNNLSDVASAVISIVGTKVAQKPPDAEHPFGHERVHYLSSMIISCIVVLLGLGFLKASVSKIINPEELNVLPVMFVLLIVSMLVKVYIYKMNMSAYKKTDIPSLKATAMDAKGDAFMTLSIMLSIVFYEATGLVIDGWVGMIVAINIVKSGVELMKESVDSILGEPACENTTDEIISIINEYDAIKNVHDLIIHNYGITKSIASVHTEISSSLSFFEVHEILDEIEKRVLLKYGIELVIHADPLCDDKEEIDISYQQLLKIIKKLNNRLLRRKRVVCSIEDFRVVGSGAKKNLVFNANLYYESGSVFEKVKKREELQCIITEYVLKELKVENPGYGCAIDYEYKKTEI